MKFFLDKYKVYKGRLVFAWQEHKGYIIAVCILSTMLLMSWLIG